MTIGVHGFLLTMVTCLGQCWYHLLSTQPLTQSCGLASGSRACARTSSVHLESRRVGSEFKKQVFLFMGLKYVIEYGQRAVPSTISFSWKIISTEGGTHRNISFWRGATRNVVYSTTLVHRISVMHWRACIVMTN